MKKMFLLSAIAITGCASPPKILDPANLTIEAESSWQAFGNTNYLDRHGRPYNGALGRAAIVMDAPLSREVTLRYGLEHRSYIEDFGDRGEERAIVGLTWKPFRK